MSALAPLAAIVAADLRREARTGEALVPMLVFALVVLVVAGVAFNLPGLDVAARQRLLPGIVWIAIAFGMLVGQARHLLADREDERGVGLLVAPVDRGLLFAVKWIEGAALGFVLEAIVLPLSIVFFALDVSHSWPRLVLVLVPCTAGLAALGTLLGSVVARLGRGEALLAILVLPAAVPLLIAGVVSTTRLLEGATLAECAPWPSVALGSAVVYAALGALLYESVLVE